MTETQPSAKRASGSSFYLAMRILPRDRREAMFEIYSFCRAVDDIADSQAPREKRRAALVEWRHDIQELYRGNVVPRTKGLAQPVREFGLAEEDFIAVIDGMEMDAIEDIRAPSLDTLDLYCDRVASAVGRLSIRAFGMAPEDGVPLAHHLGRALQLTNILRDLDEDAAIGRLYLPREALSQAGIKADDPVAALKSPSLGAACSPIVARARAHFQEAEQIMARVPRNLVKAPRIMGEVYRIILDGMVARGWSAPRDPVRVPRTRVLLILLRYAFV